MKKIVIALIIGSSFSTLPLMSQISGQNQQQLARQLELMQGVGPVIGGSYDYNKLPENAKKFIRENLKDLQVASVERDLTPLKYEVKFVDGTEIEFNSKGEVIDFEAPDGSSIECHIVEKLLPSKAYRHLKDKKLEKKVEKIDRENSKIEIEIIKGNSLKELVFNLDGKVLKSK
ncbi:MAG: PepSY-like domain-containing protein [Muribaculaceae bacterium]|nr:PepSY-like domain-containing protein [Muribaculaceae bacterium]